MCIKSYHVLITKWCNFCYFLPCNLFYDQFINCDLQDQLTIKTNTFLKKLVLCTIQLFNDKVVKMFHYYRVIQKSPHVFT